MLTASPGFTTTSGVRNAVVSASPLASDRVSENPRSDCESTRSLPDRHRVFVLLRQSRLRAGESLGQVASGDQHWGVRFNLSSGAQTSRDASIDSQISTAAGKRSEQIPNPHPTSPGPQLIRSLRQSARADPSGPIAPSPPYFAKPASDTRATASRIRAGSTI